ncbi:MAG: hypothetical protein IKK99_06505, partial [Oscillospiraceae bacterium]|nr:hypothetical protein [Oscillospiraceae bacterium]
SLNIGTSNINNKLYFGQLAVGTYTLKIAAKDAKGKYVDWSKSFTVNASSLKISMTKYPKTIVKGKSFSIEGKVTSNAKITEVAGAIYDSSGKKVQGVSVKPNATSLTIATSNINNRLYFGKLAKGTYTLKIAAKDAKGTYVDWSKSFTVT